MKLVLVFIAMLFRVANTFQQQKNTVDCNINAMECVDENDVCRLDDQGIHSF